MKKLTSISQIDCILCQELANTQIGISYEKELQRLLEIYRNLIKEYSLDGNLSIYNNVAISTIIKKIIPDLKKMAKSYMKGDIIKFNEIVDKLFKERGKKMTVSAYFPNATIKKDSLWYRGRLPDLYKKFERKDLYHIPFEEKAKIGTNRFSLIGFPSLYLGNSLECVNIETGRSGIKAISCFKCLKDFDIYDLTFFSPLNNGNNLIDQLISYPVKIAASIALYKENEKEENKKPLFREEYVLPQMLLHSVIKQRRKGKPIGLSYTSTEAIKNSNLHHNLSKYINIVIPTFQHKESGYCSLLSSFFSMTNPKIIPFQYLSDDSVEDIRKEFNNMDFLQIF